MWIHGTQRGLLEEETEPLKVMDSKDQQIAFTAPSKTQHTSARLSLSCESGMFLKLH